MKVEDIKRILGDKYLSKSRGQTLLLDENIAQKIADLVSSVGDARVLEIGPGLGIITKHLIEKGYEVEAVEVDTDFCKYLRSMGVEVINDDFLEFSIDDSLPRVIVGALPFSVSIKILLRLKEYRNHFKEWVVVMQKEVATRLTSTPNEKSYSSLSILFQILYQMDIEFDIPPRSFFPAPEVTSAVVKASLRKKPTIEVSDGFERFLQDIFRYRRKTLKNNLFDYDIKNINFPLERRAESLSIYEVVKLYRELMK